MTPERWRQIKDLATAACSLTVEERTALLNQSCAEDLTTRLGVEALITFHEQATRKLGRFTTRLTDQLPATQDVWLQIERLFQSAVDLAPEKRAAFLDKACNGDEVLRQEVEALVVYQEAAGGAIQAAIHDAAELLAMAPTGFLAKSRFAPGALLAGRYRIVGQLGKGGMGEVYRADDLKLGQSVALKFLTAQLSNDKAMLARFLGEVRTARQVTHPNVCRVHDIGEIQTETGTHHFLSMEYIDGEDLSSLLRRIGRLPSDKAVEISNQLCAGLAAAHDAGILHRDLKPANVMIDGRGKVRITDFGLAGLAEQFRGQEVMSGTPAYMSPEQLAGKEVTTRSDIYALGLVIYEIFTGKRVFDASTLDDLRRLHEHSAPTNPSLHVKEIDPQVETLILRCLAKDPADRPASAIQVAAALPGNDPLAAALAAGETPSPEMVAAAPKSGSLRPAVAIACLLTTLAVVAFLLLTATRVLLHENVPLQKSPEVLAERAQSLSRQFGYSVTPVDAAHGFELDQNFWEYAFQTQAPAGYWQRTKTGQPLTLYFWYRQSPRYLTAWRYFSGYVSLADPPMDAPGMVGMILDPRGRLVEFQAVPPQVISTESAVAQPDWKPLFTEAGLDFAKFTTTSPQWTPPGFADQQVAWQGRHPDHADVPIRVEAAAWRGQPVYFRLVAPWDKARRQEATVSSASQKAGNVLMTLIFVAMIAGALLLARRNLWQGRGDRKSANKLAAMIFALSFFGKLLGAHHVPSNSEFRILFDSAAASLLYAALSWLCYLALEPAVRRYWPKLLISWTRFLAGDFRDPMVGRDVLLGGMFGLIGHPLIIWAGRLIALRLGRGLGLATELNPLTLGGTRHLLAHFLLSLPEAGFTGLGCLLMLLLIYLIVRREWLAALASWLLFYAFLLLFFTTSWPQGLLYSIEAAAVVITVSRFGLLASISYFLFFALCFQYPMTLNLSNWYAGSSLFALFVLLGLSSYGFYTSLGGQKLFAGELLEE
ncbi:MAG: serine/threonine protein kinase [Acidobacteria bacterium]|nr:serine/threonine protein kinase [Acidobacteriota bacterium]